MNYREALLHRRSIYDINDQINVGRDVVENIVIDGLKHIPSAFNSQSNRAVILWEGAHQNFWNYLMGVMKARLKPEQWVVTEEKLKGFHAGAGTILYFIDERDVDALKDNFPRYAHNFDPWAQQSAGMLQYYVWSALEAEGLGVNLQHYTELVEEWLQKTHHLPKEWKLLAQMPFGGVVTPASEDKEFKNLMDTLKILG